MSVYTIRYFNNDLRSVVKEGRLAATFGSDCGPEGDDLFLENLLLDVPLLDWGVRRLLLDSLLLDNLFLDDLLQDNLPLDDHPMDNLLLDVPLLG